ncbi:MAG: hypothetical protein ACYC4L_15805 [Chloroflexota bacterium]
MRRYTARFSGASDPQALRLALDRHLYQAFSVYNIKADRSLAGDVWEIEIGSDAERESTWRALERFATRQNLRLEDLRWGWLLSRAQGGSAEIIVPPEPRLYVVPQRQIVRATLIHSAGLLLAGLLVFLAVSQPAFVWALLVFPIVWGLGMGLVGYPFTRVAAVRLEATGLEVRYWLPPGRQWFDWADIDYLAVEPSGRACELRAGSGRAQLPFKLLGERPTWAVMAAVVAGAGLALADDLPLGGAVYRRPREVWT